MPNGEWSSQSLCIPCFCFTSVITSEVLSEPILTLRVNIDHDPEIVFKYASKLVRALVTFQFSDVYIFIINNLILK